MQFTRSAIGRHRSRQRIRSARAAAGIYRRPYPLCAAGCSSDKRQDCAPKFGIDSPLFAITNNAPPHSRVRRMIVGALTIRAIAVGSLLDAAAARGTPDAIGDFATAIPIEVIGNLLDAPYEDREPLRAWLPAIRGALEPTSTKDQLTTGNQTVRNFPDYLRPAHPVAAPPTGRTSGARRTGIWPSASACITVRDLRWRDCKAALPCGAS